MRSRRSNARRQALQGYLAHKTTPPSAPQNLNPRPHSSTRQSAQHQKAIIATFPIPKAIGGSYVAVQPQAGLQKNCFRLYEYFTINGMAKLCGNVRRKIPMAIGGSYVAVQPQAGRLPHPLALSILVALSLAFWRETEPAREREREREIGRAI